MSTLLKLENCLVFLALAAIYFSLGYGWVMFVVLFFVPDIAFAAYAAGPKVGAWVYNSFHYFGLGAALTVVGLWLGVDLLIQIGLIQSAHVAFDRMLGYGLKHESGFTDTHLGKIGKA